MGIFIHCNIASNKAKNGQHIEFGLLQTGQLRAVIAQHTKLSEKTTDIANKTSTQLRFQRWGHGKDSTRQITDSAESLQLWALLQPAKYQKKHMNQNVAMPCVPQAPHIIELGIRFMAQPRAHTAQWFEQQTALIHGHLSKRACDATPLESQSAVHFARANYQLNQQQLPDFINLINRLQQDFPHLRLQATGPWPPYSFPLLWAESQANY